MSPVPETSGSGGGIDRLVPGGHTRTRSSGVAGGSIRPSTAHPPRYYSWRVHGATGSPGPRPSMPPGPVVPLPSSPSGSFPVSPPRRRCGQWDRGRTGVGVVERVVGVSCDRDCPHRPRPTPVRPCPNPCRRTRLELLLALMSLVVPLCTVVLVPGFVSPSVRRTLRLPCRLCPRRGRDLVLRDGVCAGYKCRVGERRG